MRNSIKTDQKGLVSIVVAMLVMIVISLIVVSFARTSRRERRQVLDRQLNTQAFYAAEAGVNDAVRLLQSDPNIQRSTCDNSDPATPFKNTTLDATANSGYSCILIDPFPDSLQYDTIDTNGSKVIPIQPKDPGDPISTINLSWQSKDDPNDSSACKDDGDVSSLVPQSNWPDGCPGMLRLDLIPVTGSFTRANLNDTVMTAFLLPNKGGGVPLPGSCPNPAYTAYQAQLTAYQQELDAYNARKTAHADAERQYKSDYDKYEWDHFWWSITPWFLRGREPQPPTPVPPFTEDPPTAPTGPAPPPTITCYGPAPTSTLSYDNSGGASDNTGFPNQGEIKVIHCDNAKTPYQCNLQINNLPTAGIEQYVIRLRSIYRSSTVNISAMKTSDPTQKHNLRGAQAIVDVTGRASDVLRRINVRVPTSSLGNGVFPDYALLSVDTLCKRFGVAPNLAPVYEPIIDPATGSSTPFPGECEL